MMATKGVHSCQVCRHGERQRVELLLAAGASIRMTAKKFGLHRDALGRHWRGHVEEERKAALIAGPDVKLNQLQERAADETMSLLDHMKYVRQGLYKMFDLSIVTGDKNGTAILAGRLQENFQMWAKLTGELSQFDKLSVTNIFVSPQFAELQATLVRVLARHPDARVEVIRAFRDLEAKATPAALPAPLPRAVDAEFTEVRDVAR
jgi:hypothetical protein